MDTQAPKAVDEPNHIAVWALLLALFALPIAVVIPPVGALLGLSAIVCGAFGLKRGAVLRERAAAGHGFSPRRGMAGFGVGAGIVSILLAIATTIFVIAYVREAAALKDCQFVPREPTPEAIEACMVDYLGRHPVIFRPDR